jgi:hypothetical protein
MLDQVELVDAIVGKLQSIPALVAALGGGEGNIKGHHYMWPSSSYLQAALVDMKAPGILVVWRETGPGNFGQSEVWKHTFSLIVRPPEPTEENVDYGNIFVLIVNGIPEDETACGNRLINEHIHPLCYPMDVPTFTRQTLMVTPEASLEYFEVRLTLTEIGDN